MINQSAAFEATRPLHGTLQSAIKNARTNTAKQDSDLVEDGLEGSTGEAMRGRVLQELKTKDLGVELSLLSRYRFGTPVHLCCFGSMSIRVRKEAPSDSGVRKQKAPRQTNDPHPLLPFLGEDSLPVAQGDKTGPADHLLILWRALPDDEVRLRLVLPVVRQGRYTGETVWSIFLPNDKSEQTPSFTPGNNEPFEFGDDLGNDAQSTGNDSE